MSETSDSPRLVHRQFGGWLALSPDSDVLRIGVLGQTEEEARQRYHRARSAWTVLLDAVQPADPSLAVEHTSDFH